MKCVICNIPIGDGGYCMDTDIHGGNACEQCCNTATSIDVPTGITEPCDYCGAPAFQACDYYCVASPTDGGTEIEDHDEVVSFGHGVIAVHFDSDTSRVFDNGSVAATFQGETAWSDAERFAYDLAYQYMIEAGK